MEEDLARAFGLWWAEGDSKTTREITFTNNCFELVEFFYEVIWDFSNLDNFRLYIYRPSENSNFQTLDDCNIRYYEDNRASQTYYILRIASTTLVEKWRSHVDSLKNDESLFRFILQGIFAGEGSVVQSSKRSRTLKISQGCRSEFLERIMDQFFTDYNFRQENRIEKMKIL